MYICIYIQWFLDSIRKSFNSITLECCLLHMKSFHEIAVMVNFSKPLCTGTSYLLLPSYFMNSESGGIKSRLKRYTSCSSNIICEPSHLLTIYLSCKHRIVVFEKEFSFFWLTFSVYSMEWVIVLFIVCFSGGPCLCTCQNGLCLFFLPPSTSKTWAPKGDWGDLVPPSLTYPSRKLSSPQAWNLGKTLISPFWTGFYPSSTCVWVGSQQLDIKRQPFRTLDVETAHSLLNFCRKKWGKYSTIV